MMKPLLHKLKTKAVAKPKLMNLEEVLALTRNSQLNPPLLQWASKRNVLDRYGCDPWVVQHDGYYYYIVVSTEKDKLLVSKSKKLKDIARETQVAVWQSWNPASTEDLWAPELHFLNGKWYIYVACYKDDPENRRMYVLEADTDDPQGSYTLKGKITSPDDHWAIDGTILEHDNKMYFVWSGWEGDVNIQQNLYIAPMSNPWTISGERVCIARPEYPWEVNHAPFVNEGPQVLSRDGQLFIIYSASGSWTDDYCLGQLKYVGGDIMKPISWKKSAKPVFSKSRTLYGPGHASFVQSDNDTKHWIVYHTAKSKNAGWNREVRAKTFKWNKDGSPNFGRPR